MSKSQASRPAPRANYVLTIEGYHRLRCLHDQLRLMSHISLACLAIDEENDPHIPIKAWYASFDAFAAQAGEILEKVGWQVESRDDTRH